VATAALTIRAAESADYDRIIGNLDAWWGGRQMATMLPRLFFTHFRPWTYVAERDGALVGFLAALRSQTDPGQIYCHFIGVAPEARGHRVGETLYQRLFADAAVAGCREVLAVTAPTNTGSVTFHRRLGFETLPGPGTWDGIPYTPDYDGPGEDRVRFQRRIPGVSSLQPGFGPVSPHNRPEDMNIPVVP
jgi:L-amino acid N-acyltransferase YncA